MRNKAENSLASYVSSLLWGHPMLMFVPIRDRRRNRDTLADKLRLSLLERVSGSRESTGVF